MNHNIEIILTVLIAASFLSIGAWFLDQIIQEVKNRETGKRTREPDGTPVIYLYPTGTESRARDL